MFFVASPERFRLRPLGRLGLWLAIAGAIALSPLKASVTAADTRSVEVDLLIVGGTESGCAAAVQAARMGVRSIALVNDIDWLGGQFSGEALGAIDENRGPQGYDQTTPFPRSGLFLEVIERIERQNLVKYGRARPGNTRVITTCLPADAAAVFNDVLGPYVDRGQVQVYSRYAPAGVTVAGTPPTVRGVEFESDEPGAPRLRVAAKLTIDASDWGDVIRLSGAEYEFGPDLKEKYGEPLAPTSREDYPLTDMNPITYCLVLKETDRWEPIPPPPGYDPRHYDQHRYPRDPLWIYESRRLIDHYNYADVVGPDALLLCFPASDYPLDVLPQHVADALEATEPGASRKNIVELTRQQRQIVFEDAKRYSLGLLHYLQTVAHDAMPDQTHSFRRFELTDEFGTADRCPPKPYVRESLRLRALTMVRQQETTGWGGRAVNFAEVMPHDGIASWQFEYDFHPTKRVFLDGERRDGPWTNAFRTGRTWGPPYSGRSIFPARSLIPLELDGLLGAQKNLGYTSIVSSAVRLHDQSLAIGQAAGGLAAMALADGVQPRALPFDRHRMSRLWRSLASSPDGGSPVLLWPFRDVAPDHPSFAAVQLLAIHRMLPLSPREIDFQPDARATAEWRQAVCEATRGELNAEPPGLPEGEFTRGEFAIAWWNDVANLPLRPWERLTPTDADGDGIVDVDDPLPFDPRHSTWGDYVPPPEEDGVPPDLDPSAGKLWRFNFTGPGGKSPQGFTSDLGQTFDAARGFGWERDLTGSFRRRGAFDDDLRDSFRFTRTHDVWELTVPNGRYRVIACVGDAAHDQRGQWVAVERSPLMQNVNTTAGSFFEAGTDITVADGRLTVELGRPGGTTNTCLCWLIVSGL